MTKLLATIILLPTLLVSPLLAVDIEGTYVCKLVYYDGSSADYVYKVSSSELRTSKLGESYETKYIETYLGKNGYKIFTKRDDGYDVSATDTVVILSPTESSKVIHITKVKIHSMWFYDARPDVGKCSKV